LIAGSQLNIATGSARSVTEENLILLGRMNTYFSLLFDTIPGAPAGSLEMMRLQLRPLSFTISAPRKSANLAAVVREVDFLLSVVNIM
jgi:hypothetical protein